MFFGILHSCVSRYGRRIIGLAATGQFLFLCGAGHAQSARDMAVELSAVVQASPPAIRLEWPRARVAVAGQTIARRSNPYQAWGAATNLAPGATAFTDTAVQAGRWYEYRVRRTFVAGGYAQAFGAIAAGVEVAAVDWRGKLVLVVADAVRDPLAPEINRLEQDLRGDGWQVIREELPANIAAPAVKSRIRQRYLADPANTRAVLLLGPVPAPRSGNFAPDDHTAERRGAWPADVYYADMDGAWSDNSVSNTSATDRTYHNVPRDGRFDPSTTPGASPGGPELELGRIDLRGMEPAGGGVSEIDLLRAYLARDHDFRHRAGLYANVPRRGLVDDRFGYFSGEAFAAVAWRALPAFFGGDASRARSGRWFPEAESASYLFGYLCGPGSITSADDVTTADFQSRASRVVFNVLFGSAFADWDRAGSFLRAPLAGPAGSLGLASVWGGRPEWYFHPMAIGETVGYCARLAQSYNTSAASGYRNASYARGVHPALMGDPTLRLEYPMPPANATARWTGSAAVLAWDLPAGEPDLGCHIFRAWYPGDRYYRINAQPVFGTSFTDEGAAPGQTYMVRRIALQETGSGSYYNLSQGAFAGWVGPVPTPPPPPTPTPVPTPTPRPVGVRAKPDFDGDGRLDLCWQNAAGGAVAAWLMDGERFLGSEAFDLQYPAGRWKVVGTWDFDRDGDHDLLWQNSRTAALAVWYLDGMHVAQSVILPQRPGSALWRVVAIADFDGDGDGDLIWQPAGKGWLAIWYMNGINLERAEALAGRVANPAWRVRGAADLDGDSDPDLLWQNNSTGALVAWLMSGIQRDGVQALGLQALNRNWRVVGLGDADGDGDTDILWQQVRSGAGAVWFMDRLNYAESRFFTRQIGTPGWQIRNNREIE